MAGSDLDGDEYGVIWDPELTFIRNEPAVLLILVYFNIIIKADYSPIIHNEQNSLNIKHDNFQNELADFFVNYMKHDSIGRIANAHLANSDLYGIKTKV
jgi:hypothetical protein